MTNEIFTQKFRFDCGPASVENVLSSTLGGTVEYPELIRELGASMESGTDPRRIEIYLLKMGLQVVEGRGMVQLQRCLNEGGCGLVVFQSGGSLAEADELLCGHYSVVEKIENGIVHLQDPAIWDDLGYGVGRDKMSTIDFERRWKDVSGKGEYLEKWFLGVRG